MSKCWLGTKIAFARDCTCIVIRHHKAYQLTYHNWRLMQNEVYWIPTYFFFEFQILESEFQFLNYSTAEIEKNFPTGIFGIENGIGIPLTMGVPEIRTKNWNSQPRGTCRQKFWRDGIGIGFNVGWWWKVDVRMHRCHIFGGETDAIAIGGMDVV